MLNMIEYMRKREALNRNTRTQDLRDSALRPTSMEETLKGYIFII